MHGPDPTVDVGRIVQVFARDPAYTGEVGEVPICIPLLANATGFDDDVVCIRRGGSLLPLLLEKGKLARPIPHQGFKPSVVDDAFKAQMLFAIVRQTRSTFEKALGRVPKWWNRGPLMVRFDCREADGELVNAYYRRLPDVLDARPDPALAEQATISELANRFANLMERTRTATGQDAEQLQRLLDEAQATEIEMHDLLRTWADDATGVRAALSDTLPQSLQKLATAVRVAQQAGARTALDGPGAGGFRAKAGNAKRWLLAKLQAPVPNAPTTTTPAAGAQPALATGGLDGPPSPRQELRFGVFAAVPSDLEQVGALVSTALMHDVIVHETVHALLDGLRPQLFYAPNAEAMAFHEGFADLVAVFSRFANRELVRAALVRSGDAGDVGDDLLVSIGTQFGFTATTHGAALRSAIADDPTPWSSHTSPRRFDPYGSAHVLGGTLLCAVFAAFRVVFRDKSAQLRVVTGTQRSEQAFDLLAARASDLGMQFLRLLIRAIDFVPPVDVRFGDYLRAVITADSDDYPADKWRYRERLVEQFRRYRIPVLANDLRGATARLPMHPSALQWQRFPECKDLPSDHPYRFFEHADGWLEESGASGDEQAGAGDTSQEKGARASLEAGIAAASPEFRCAFALDEAVPVTVGRTWESARIVDGDHVVRERGIELIQMRQHTDIGRIYGGSTVLLRQTKGVWRPRYAIYRRVGSALREDEQRRFLAVCDRGLARAWRSLRDTADLDGIAQHFTRHLHQSGCQGSIP